MGRLDVLKLRCSGGQACCVVRCRGGQACCVVRCSGGQA